MTGEKQTAKMFFKGVRDAVPICLGYIPISFAFGMTARESGLELWAAVLISLTNFTSAGQLAGTAIIAASGGYIEIAVTTFIINIRYMLMSLSLSQKIEEKMPTLHRAILSFGITDEIFAVASQSEGRVTTPYFAGLIVLPYMSWTLSTLFGATAATLLPDAVCSALGIAIYGMFLAIIIPPAKKVKPIFITVLISAAISCIFRFTPILNRLSFGWVVIICAVTASALAALRFPVSDEE